MHIAIDNRLRAYRIGGIPAYTEQLTHALLELAPAERLTLFEHRRRPRAAAQPGVAQRRVIIAGSSACCRWSCGVCARTCCIFLISSRSSACAGPA
jgi:hypothetical protein